MAFARVRWQRVSFVFLSNIFHLFYVALLQRIISSRSKRAASSEQKVFVRTVPKHSLYCVLPVFSLSLSLSVTLLLFWNFVMTILWIAKIQSKWDFLSGKSPKHLNLFFGAESRISLSKKGIHSLCTCPPFVWVEIICSVWFCLLFWVACLWCSVRWVLWGWFLN